MADFSKVDWIAVLGVVSQVEAEVKALQAATDVNSEAKALGDLVETFMSAAEALSNKDLVNNEALKSLVGDVIKTISDVQAIKPVPSA